MEQGQSGQAQQRRTRQRPLTRAARQGRMAHTRSQARTSQVQLVRGVQVEVMHRRRSACWYTSAHSLLLTHSNNHTQAHPCWQAGAPPAQAHLPAPARLPQR